MEELKKDDLIAFKYCDEKGSINEASNPNGSLENIAGIFNKNKNILGMMPHPERMVDKLISNNDGVNLFSSLLNWFIDENYKWNHWKTWSKIRWV